MATCFHQLYDKYFYLYALLGMEPLWCASMLNVDTGNLIMQPKANSIFCC